MRNPSESFPAPGEPPQEEIRSGDHREKLEAGCPVGCAYCVITKVESRREMWDKKTILGINKAVTILNAPPDLTNKDARDEFYNFPIELLKGDIVGFNAMSDPFWPKYAKELDYFMEHVPQVAKMVVCVTKFNPPMKTLERLARIPNFRLNVSITGLDDLERTKTIQRLATLQKAKELGIKAFPIVHPYIAGMADLSFLPELKATGYDEIDFKGLRYDDATMSGWMPSESRKHYRLTGGDEVLVEDGWREKVEGAGMSLVSPKEWYKRDWVNLEPKLSREEAEEKVKKIIEMANITSSDTDEAVIEAAVQRRM